MYAEAFECAPVALLLVRTGGVIEHANHEAERLFGYEPGTLDGRHVDLLVPARFRTQHGALMDAFHRHPETRTMGAGRELYGVRSDGRELRIEVGLTRLDRPEGGHLIMASVVDLSARLRDDERFRAAFEAAPNAMILVDAAGRIVLVNGQTEALFGYDRGELLGEPIELLVPQDMRARHPAFVKVYTAAPVPRPMGSGRDLHGQRKDGTLVPIEVGLRPLRGPDGDYVISSVVDISERVQARERLMQRNEELEQFAYRTSHDLRAPLVTMKGLAEFIGEDAARGANDEVVANAARVVHLADRMLHLVEGILALARSDYANEPAAEVDVGALVEAARENLGGALRAAGVSLVYVPAHRRPLLGQPTRVTQILENLISNGIKYADPAKAERHVVVRTFSGPHQFHLQVEDNGLGIPAERHGQVFAIFTRFHADRGPGSGLGLYLVRQHVLKLGGTIEFESSPAGTTFHVTVPFRLRTSPLPKAG